MYNISSIRSVFLASCLATFLILVLTPAPGFADLPLSLEKVHFDWVCVTDAPLIEAYIPLAEHRQGQGLAPLVLGLDEVIRWSPAAEDTTATLRWLATVATEQWGAEYLLLGGSHDLLPAPIHRLASSVFDFENPTDAYYRCLAGEWDVNGDGLVADWDEDDADPEVHIHLGRIPADDPESVGHAVAKIINFENRSAEQTNGALFVASLMDPNWQPGSPYPNAALSMAINRRETVMALRPELRMGSLFQGDQPVPPEDDPLNPVALVDSLSARPHDFVHFQLNGMAWAWELAQFLTVNSETFEPMAGCGHSFLATMVSGGVADTRGDGILKTLLTMPEAGAAGVVAPTGMGYLSPHDHFQEYLWTAMLNGSCDRLGEAFSQAQTEFLAQGDFAHSGAASTYWYQAILGDPATMLDPLTQPVAQAPQPLADLNLRAAPNPFNPATTIQFEVQGLNGTEQPVQVSIFNVAGQRVAVLLDKSLSSGPHSVTWSDGPSSGLYFARVDVAGHQETIKLMLVE